MIQPLSFGIFLTLLLFSFAAAAPAYADRDDRGRGRGRGHDRHHSRHDKHHRPIKRTVVVRPNVISIWPGYHPSYHSAYRAPRYYYGPQEVNMTCPGGKEVTIRANGLSIDQMLDKANQFCLSQNGGNTYRADLLSGNRHCREYQSKINIGGDTERSYGRACLQPDGSWEIMN